MSAGPGALHFPISILAPSSSWVWQHRCVGSSEVLWHFGRGLVWSLWSVCVYVGSQRVSVHVLENGGEIPEEPCLSLYALLPLGSNAHYPTPLLCKLHRCVLTEWSWPCPPAQVWELQWGLSAASGALPQWAGGHGACAVLKASSVPSGSSAMSGNLS